MPEYRRLYRPGGTYFFTIVTHGRQPLFADARNVGLVRQAIAETKSLKPLTLLVAVVLPDHLHLLMRLPEGDADFSSRLGMIKARLSRALTTRHIGDLPDLSRSRREHHDSAVWQRRFWEHSIRDEADFETHLHYIHFNPVRHGLVTCPHAWPHSSFSRWVARGVYDEHWCCTCGSGKLHKQPYPASLDGMAGE